MIVVWWFVIVICSLILFSGLYVWFESQIYTDHYIPEFETEKKVREIKLRLADIEWRMNKNDESTSSSDNPQCRRWVLYNKKDKDKIYVTCRLAKRKIVMTQKICIYTAANNTTETIFVDKWEICPNQMQCIYEPNKTVPMIEQMMKSLEEDS